eukprot:441940_1
MSTSHSHQQSSSEESTPEPTQIQPAQIHQKTIQKYIYKTANISFEDATKLSPNYQNAKNKLLNIGFNQHVIKKALQISNNDINKAMQYFKHNHIIPKYPDLMTIERINKLKVNDKCDFRDPKGLFFVVTILAKNNKFLTLHYDVEGDKHDKDATIDISIALSRFANAYSISRRQSYRFPEIKQWEYINIKTPYPNPGHQWQCGRIIQISDTSGQVNVEYIFNGMYHKWWSHLDNVKEISLCSYQSFLEGVNKNTQFNTCSYHISGNVLTSIGYPSDKIMKALHLNKGDINKSREYFEKNHIFPALLKNVNVEHKYDTEFKNENETESNEITKNKNNENMSSNGTKSVARSTKDTHNEMTNQLSSFAKPAHRLKQIEKGDYVNINPLYRYPHHGWQCGKIENVYTNGQVKVAYMVNGREYTYVVHLDNEAEIDLCSYENAKKYLCTIGYSETEVDSALHATDNNINKAIQHFRNNNIVPALPKNMTIDQISTLRFYDKVDVRHQQGAYILATILEKQETFLTIHYDCDGADHGNDEKINYLVDTNRFVKAYQMSSRKANRLTEVKKGDFVNINPLHTNPQHKWQCGKITNTYAGHVRVEYIFHGQKYFYWVHLDNECEIDRCWYHTTSKAMHDQKDHINVNVERCSYHKIGRTLTNIGYPVDAVITALQLNKGNIDKVREYLNKNNIMPKFPKQMNIEQIDGVRLNDECDIRFIDGRFYYAVKYDFVMDAYEDANNSTLHVLKTECNKCQKCIYHGQEFWHCYDVTDAFPDGYDICNHCYHRSRIIKNICRINHPNVK